MNSFQLFSLLSLILIQTSQQKQASYPTRGIVMFLLLSTSPPPAAFVWFYLSRSIRLVVVFVLHWLLPWWIALDDFLCDFLLHFRQLIVACVVLHQGPTKVDPHPDWLLCWQIFVLCAFLFPGLPSGGDYLLRAIVRSLVWGHGGGCAKDGSTINEPTPPPIAQTFVGGMVVFGDDWLALR